MRGLSRREPVFRDDAGGRDERGLGGGLDLPQGGLDDRRALRVAVGRGQERPQGDDGGTVQSHQGRPGDVHGNQPQHPVPGAQVVTGRQERGQGRPEVEGDAHLRRRGLHLEQVERLFEANGLEAAVEAGHLPGVRRHLKVSLSDPPRPAGPLDLERPHPSGRVLHQTSSVSVSTGTRMTSVASSSPRMVSCTISGPMAPTTSSSRRKNRDTPEMEMGGTRGR